MGAGKCTKKTCGGCVEYNGVARQGRHCNTCEHRYEHHDDPAPSPKKASSSKKRARSPSVSASDSDGDAVSRSSPPPQSGDEWEDDNDNKDLVKHYLSQRSIELKPVAFAKLKGSGKNLLASKAEVNAGLKGGRSKLDSTLKAAIKESHDEKDKKGKKARQSHESTVDGRLHQVGKVFMLLNSYKESSWTLPKPDDIKRHRLAKLVVNDPPSFGSQWGAKRLGEWVEDLFPLVLQYQRERAAQDPDYKPTRPLWYALSRTGTGRATHLFLVRDANLSGRDLADLIIGKGKVVRFLVFAPLYAIPEDLFTEWYKEGKNAAMVKAMARGEVFAEDSDDDDAEVVIVDPPPKVKREPKVKLEPKESKKPLKRVTRSSKRQKTASPAPDREVTDLTVEDTGETMSVEEARELYRFNNAQVLQDMAVEDDERHYAGHPALAGPSNVSAGPGSASASVSAGPSTSGASTSALPTTSSSDWSWEAPELDEGSTIPMRWSLGIPPPPPPAKKFE